MSLDVSLYRKYHVSYDNGKTLEPKEEFVFDASITHNLDTMAAYAGIYRACWRPEEIKATKAKDIIPILERGYKELKEKPEYFMQFNASNGWGVYENFLPWVKEYLDACKEFPECEIHVSRQCYLQNNKAPLSKQAKRGFLFIVCSL